MIVHKGFPFLLLLFFFNPYVSDDFLWLESQKWCFWVRGYKHAEDWLSITSQFSEIIVPIYVPPRKL